MRSLFPSMLVLLCLAACDPAEDDPADPGSDTTAESDPGVTTGGPDGTGTLTPPTDDGTAPAPDLYEIGTNIAGKTSPVAFDQAADGGNVDVVLGSQGAWMVVVAARTNMFPDDVKRVDVEASVTPPGGTAYGKLKFKKRPLLNGGDGYKYLMNVFLVVSNNLEWNGQQAILSVKLSAPEGVGGPEITDEVTVTLVQILDG